MKRLLLFALSSIAFATASHAQITKGTVLLGGSIGASTYSTEFAQTKNKTKGFTLSPSLGFTVKDNHVLGVSLTYGHESNKSPYSKATANLYGGGLFYRRYLPLGKSFHFYGQTDARYNYLHRKYGVDSIYRNTEKVKTGRLSLSPGIAYAISKRFHLEVAMNDLLSLNYLQTQYNWNSPSDTREGKSEHFSFQSNMNLSTDLVIGFRILLGKQPKE